MQQIGIALIWLALATSSAPAQEMTFGGGRDSRDERVSTWIAYFDQSQGRFVGGLTLNYNKVLWKAEYAQQLDTLLRGNTWRLGKHFWSTFDTNLPLTMAGRKIAPGYYYLGLQRSDDGSTWSLALIDSTAARRQRLDAFNIASASVVHSVPFSFDRHSTEVGELSLFLEVDGGVSSGGVARGIHSSVTLRMEFGPFRLAIPVKVDTPL